MENIIHHIRKIRRQPEEKKRHLLHVIMVVFGIILFSLWVYSLGTKFASSEPKTQDTIKPFSSLKDNIVGGYNSMSNPQ